jgi:uncharacterized protein
MNREIAISRLKPFEPRLRERGVTSLYLFGSTARGDARADSDVDLVFDVAPETRFSLFDQARFITELSSELGTGVDLILRRELHPYLKPRIEAELVKVF